MHGNADPSLGLHRKATLTLFHSRRKIVFILEGEPSVLRIPFKESGFAPKFAVLDSPHEEPFMLRTKSNGGIYEFSIPPLSKSRQVHLKGGDFRNAIELKTLLRPRLLSLSATLNYPTYLGMPAETMDLKSGKLLAPQGSSLRIRGLSSRTLGKSSRRREFFPICKFNDEPRIFPSTRLLVPQRFARYVCIFAVQPTYF